MTYPEILLIELYNAKLYSKGEPIDIFLIQNLKAVPRKTISQTAYRLAQKEYIERIPGGKYKLSPLGAQYIRERNPAFKQFDSIKNMSSKKILVIFNIPDSKKKQREWFRWQLKKFHFEMVQRGVWVGGALFSHEFQNYLREIKIDQHIEIFELASPYRKEV